MFDEVGFLQTVTLFDFPDQSLEKDVLESHYCYRLVIRNTLKKIFPAKFFDASIDKGETRQTKTEKLKKELHGLLPYFKCLGFPQEESPQIPFTLSFYLVSIYRANAFKFFFNMISSWLMPGKRLNVLLVYAVDFAIPALGQDLYTLCEVMIQVESLEEYRAIRQNLPLIETEVRMGVASQYYARRILEVKGLSSDEKVALIQESIAHLIKRFPEHFDADLITEMQHIMVICSDQFKLNRDSRHLSRIIATHYLYRKFLKSLVSNSPKKRHLNLKIFRAKLYLATGQEQVVGIFVALNFLREKEILEERHLLKAVQECIPEARAVEGSFFVNRVGSEEVRTLYLEVKKVKKKGFTSQEIEKLRRELSAAIRDRIEYLLPHVVMPPNEEEVIRNILSLSSQIKYVRDIPQVVISYDKQTPANLFFTIILVRVIKSESPPSIHQLFRSSGTFLEYIPDRSKIVGYVRKRYAKELTVFKVKFPKDEFLRGDQTLDLYKARQVIVSELMRILGEIRDFNGGMISKQNELLEKVRALLTNSGRYNELLLENFFYSLTPVLMRTFLEAETLKSLFLMLLDALEEGFFPEKHYHFKAKVCSNNLLIIIIVEDFSLKDEVNKLVNRLNLNELASSFITVSDHPCLGYIYRCEDPAKREHLVNTLQLGLEQSHRKVAPVPIEAHLQL
jgi:hypothetical protein